MITQIFVSWLAVSGGCVKRYRRNNFTRLLVITLRSFIDFHQVVTCKRLPGFDSFPSHPLFLLFPPLTLSRRALHLLWFPRSWWGPDVVQCKACVCMCSISSGSLSGRLSFLALAVRQSIRCGLDGTTRAIVWNLRVLLPFSIFLSLSLVVFWLYIYVYSKRGMKMRERKSHWMISMGTKGLMLAGSILVISFGRCLSRDPARRSIKVLRFCDRRQKTLLDLIFSPGVFFISKSRSGDDIATSPNLMKTLKSDKTELKESRKSKKGKLVEKWYGSSRWWRNTSAVRSTDFGFDFWKMWPSYNSRLPINSFEVLKIYFSLPSLLFTGPTVGPTLPPLLFYFQMPDCGSDKM